MNAHQNPHHIDTLLVVKGSHISAAFSALSAVAPPKGVTVTPVTMLRLGQGANQSAVILKTNAQAVDIAVPRAMRQKIQKIKGADSASIRVSLNVVPATGVSVATSVAACDSPEPSHVATFAFTTGATANQWNHTIPANDALTLDAIRNLIRQTPPDVQAVLETARKWEREQLILDHLPQVRLIARRIHERLPGSVNLDDLVSTGALGLISAIDRFDPSLNVKLKTYAEYKIRGAILDSLRGLDWAPRQHRKRSKQIEAAIAVVEQRLHHAPTEEEIAVHLGVTIETYHEWLVELQGLNVGSLETATPDDEGSRDLLSFISDDKEFWPSSLMERSELQKLLAEAIGKMPEMEKTVLSLYYYEELTLREISKLVHLHESRISQLKSQAILRLRAYMERLWPCPRGM